MKRQTAKEYLAVAEQILSLSPRDVRLGHPHPCPVCRGSNPSGTRLPENCIWCRRKEAETAAIMRKLNNQKPLDPEFSKTVDKHFWELV